MPQVQLRELDKTLRSQFQMRELHPGQEDVIRSVMAGHNSLSIVPTGGGKSLCDQLSAMHLEGVTILISPWPPRNIRWNVCEPLAPLERVGQPLKGEVIHVTPERLESAELVASLQKVKIDFVVVDEAHCVSQWGHDFRPAYLNIARVLNELGHPPVLARTAMATPGLSEDIRRQLGLEEMRVFRTSLVRENLYFSAQVLENAEQKDAALLSYVRASHGPGIIYASTVRAVREIHRLLTEAGISAQLDHGRLKPEEREASQNEFLSGRSGILVATHAFGVGIDKADIRFVIHYDFPGSLEAYYQEAGRAGRDGQPARCVLLYLKKDKGPPASSSARKYPSLEDFSRVYATLRDLSAGGGIIVRADLEHRLPGFSKGKLTVIVTYLKQLGVVVEKKRGRLAVPHPGLKAEDLAKIANRDRERGERDQEKLTQMIGYAQSALCRWKIMAHSFAEAGDGLNCHHCDNCEHPVL